MYRIKIQFRLSLAMAAVTYSALFLATVKNPSQQQLSYLFACTVTLLFVSSLRARSAETPEGRAWWTGVSAFGWLYLVLAGTAWNDLLPTTEPVRDFSLWLTVHYGPFPTAAGRGPWYTNAMHDANNDFFAGTARLFVLGLTFVFAGLGGVLSLLTGNRRPAAPADAGSEINQL